MQKIPRGCGNNFSKCEGEDGTRVSEVGDGQRKTVAAPDFRANPPVELDYTGAPMANKVANEPARLLLVWNHVPCKSTGAGIILWRLFQTYPAEKLWLLTSSVIARHVASFDPVPPPERQHTVFQAFFPHRYVDRLAELLNALMLPVMVWRGIRLARQKRIEALFTVPWNALFVAAYFVHKFTGLPLYVYIMDDPAGGPSYPAWKRVFYTLLMPRILRAASRVWCVSSYTCEEFERRYSVQCEPLWPPVDIEEFRRGREEATGPSPGTVHIVYTGAIYDAQMDALQILVQALNSKDATPRGDKQFRLTLCTSLPNHTLERMALTGPAIRSQHVPLKEMPRVLAEADILFLPYTFKAQLEHVARTSFPSKIAEYLSAGTPILVHAPPYATATRFFREHGCGYVVDQPDPQALRQALQALSEDEGLRRKLTTRGLEVAKQIFDHQQIVPAFRQALSGLPRKTPEGKER